jgi:hypothetical protein
MLLSDRAPAILCHPSAGGPASPPSPGTDRDPRARLRVPVAVALVTRVMVTTSFALLAPGPTQFVLVLAGGLR